MTQTASETVPTETPDETLTCDFCGAEVPRVRRVALDRGYDRLQKPHRVQYACPECSDRKERERSDRKERERAADAP